MDDALSPRNTMSGTLSNGTNMDFGFMDELLSEGCWLETTACSNLFQQDPNTPQNVRHDDTENTFFSGTLPHSAETQTETFGGNQSLDHNMTGGAESSGQLDSYPVQGGRNLDENGTINPSLELNRRWWIEPRANQLHDSSVKERLLHALRYIRESTKDGDVLVQIWVPTNRGGRNVLTTSGQPFSLNPYCQRLVNYRTISTNYLFSAEEDSSMAIGLPGRVFLGRLPEWTPDVRYFSSEEYPRVDFAQRYDVRGTLALPVFERGSQACLGVVEVVMTTQNIDYHPELENICNALQAVDLRTSEVFSIPHPKVPSDSYQVVLPEIIEVVRAVCETHRLPLAQTWVPCFQQGKKGSRHTDKNYADCVSTVDAACCISDPRIWGFHYACSEHHLFRGQGLVGKAFATNQPCFSTDVTAFSKTEYPLSHYARMFGLQAAVAIRLRSLYSGTADYVLEFFLPVDCINNEEQKLMLNSLSVIIQQVCQSLRVVTDKELEDDTVSSVNKAIPLGWMLERSTSSGRPNGEEVSEMGATPSIETSAEKSSGISSVIQAQQKGKSVLHPASLSLEFQEQESEEYNVTSHWDPAEVDLHSGKIFSNVKQQQRQGLSKDNVEGGDSSFGKPRIENAGKETEKRRTKSEKTVSLEVLRQYFAGSLKDAAKSIGVCPTTLKRICRQHGINRWPSRKIKKVGNSLRKLQVVINSVQGAEGVVQISSLYKDFPKAYGSGLTSENPARGDQLSTLEQTSHLKSSNAQPEGAFSNVAPEKLQTSSCSQSSSSGLSCSTVAQSHSLATLVNEDASKAENGSCMLKRAYSEAELHASSKDEETRPPSRSLSHESLSEHPSLGGPSYLPVSIPLSRDCNSVRVKVTYGEEKVRFSLQPSWGFQDLLREIARRFNIYDVSVIDVKYLDDDSEWVLLTCDADLEECKEIYKSSSVQPMKLSIHLVARPDPRNSWGSTALS
ncbi:hypothetical protein AAC387_Pa11g2108 [Persea americana]